MSYCERNVKQNRSREKERHLCQADDVALGGRRVWSLFSVVENAAVPIGFREWAIFSPPEMPADADQLQLWVAH